MKLTIFTPTFNRESVLPRLYKSLVDQTNTNFVWLIVDDGSTDNTENLINKWISEQKIKIRYYKQENLGKSMAHNYGVSLTDTELFTCIDSDDFISVNAVDVILNKWNSSDKTQTGIVCFKNKIGDKTSPLDFNCSISECTLRDLYIKHNYIGETMLIYKTSLLQRHQFPKFRGEKFIPEAYLYDLLDNDGNLLILNEYLYYYEYMNDGYTNNMAKLIVDNHYGYLAFITQRLGFDKTLKQKLSDTIRYVAIQQTFMNRNIIQDAVYPIIAILMYPFGYYMYIYKYKKFMNK